MQIVMRLIITFTLLLLLLSSSITVKGLAPKGHPKEMKTKSVEKTLIRMLLNRYEQFGVIGRPVSDSKIKVDVRYGLQLFQILDLDENKQILRTNCWSMYKWTDALLRWNESEYGNIKIVRIFSSHIWTPDIKLYNFADERLREQRAARLLVSSDGQVLWVPQVLFKSTCEVEITYFPFDTQICMLEFGSWTYDKSQMDILWWVPDEKPLVEMPYLDFSDYVPSNEWRTDGEKERDIHHTNRTMQIRSVKKHRRRRQTIGSEVITRQYPVLRYLLRLRRNPSFYVFMLVIPCVLLSSLTLVVFWLPPESPAKMMLGMNIFVAFFVLLLLLAESTPSAVKNFPLIGVYFCLNMIMITLSTFLATLVIHLYFRGDRNGNVPPLLRKIIIEGIGRLTLVRQRIPLPDTEKNTRIPPKQSNTKSHKRTQRPEIPGYKFATESDTCYPDERFGMYDGAQQPLPTRRMYGDKFMGGVGMDWFGGANCHPMHLYNDQFDAFNMEKSQVFNPAEHILHQNSMTKSAYGMNGIPVPSKEATDSFDPDNSKTILSTSTLERDVRDLKKYVKTLVNRQKDVSRKGLVAMEWRTLAIVLDRLFFFIYITTIAIAVVVSIPRSTEPELLAAFRDDNE